ncbi:MAG: DUF4340 domain-containing protein [Betaproteobacteria bacterium]|jgi:hypothetical protein|nr:DUF4340 domain-containing protein [Betaproteobacteria bacterium]
MNRKSFLILLGLVAILGGAGLALFWNGLSAWRKSDAKIGSKLFEKLAVNDVAQIQLTDGKGSVRLLIKDKRWTVEQRNGYGANNQDIGDLLIKLTDLKVVQTESVGESLLPRLNLVDPGKDAKTDAKADDKADAKSDAKGTRLELFDAAGKSMASILLGKKVIKTEDSPLPIKPQTPVGRYVLMPGSPTVLVVSDALVVAEANAGRWLAKNFFKAERIRALAVSGDGAQWKISRPEEYGQWKFADGGGELDASAAVGAVNALAGLAFNDVAIDVKADALAKARTFVAETYDNLSYTVKIAKKAESDDYYLTVAVAGEPPRERKPEKGEKPEDKERLDKQFADALTKLDERLKAEKELGAWTFVVAGKTLEPLLKDRAGLIAKPRQPGAGGPPGMPPGMFPGMR